MDLFKSVISDCICQDIHVCLKNNALTGAVLLTYCAIDAMSFLSMPPNQDEVKKNDFISWVDKYIKTDSTQPYQYQGIDLYGARCGLAHNYGVESNLSRSNQCKIIVYATNKLKHSYDPAKNPKMVILDVNLFIRDFFDAVDKFLADIERDRNLIKQVEGRLPKMFRILKY